MAHYTHCSLNKKYSGILVVDSKSYFKSGGWGVGLVLSISFTLSASCISPSIGASSALITVSHESSGLPLLSQESKTLVKQSKQLSAGYVHISESGMFKQIPKGRHF